MKAKLIIKTTESRSAYNKARKIYLERKGEIHCSLCPYHGNENRDCNYYGGYEKDGIKYPNWKLISKNRKQWMNKKLKIEREYNHYAKGDYIEISF
jgi:hypothetical protein